jgi:hypothetical protein
VGSGTIPSQRIAAEEGGGSFGLQEARSDRERIAEMFHVEQFRLFPK